MTPIAPMLDQKPGADAARAFFPESQSTKTEDGG